MSTGFKRKTHIGSGAEFEHALWILDMTPEEYLRSKSGPPSNAAAIRDAPFANALERYKTQHLVTLSDQTKKNYLPVLADHHAWLVDHFGHEPMVSEVTETELMGYMLTRNQCRRGYGQKTDRGESSVKYKNMVLGCLKGLYKFFFKSRLTATNIAAPLKMAVLHRALPRHLNLVEAERLLELAKSKRRYASRDYALTAFMLMAGARIEEVTSVRVGDIDFASDLVRLYGKGRHREKKPRDVSVGSRLRGILIDWLNRGHGLTLVDDHVVGPPGCRDKFLFTTLTSGRHERLTTANVRCTLNRLFDALLADMEQGTDESHEQRKRRSRAGSRAPMTKQARSLRQNFTPHSLRHTFAFSALEMGIDLPTIQEWLGHDDLKTTAIYLKTTTQEQKMKMEKHPLAGMHRKDVIKSRD